MPAAVPSPPPAAVETVAVETAAVAAAAPPASAPPVEPAQILQMVESTRDVFSRAAQPPRWPMYVRQLKQFIRGVDQAFDERKWGFATVMEFLRVCQREGLFRLERDRRGQIRVFPGAALQTASTATPAPAGPDEPRDVYESEPVDTVRDSPSDVGKVSGIDSGSVRLQPDLDKGTPEVNGNVIDMDEQPARGRGRRTRKAPSTGKPPARKSTGARTSTSRRRKRPVPA